MHNKKLSVTEDVKISYLPLLLKYYHSSTALAVRAVDLSCAT